MLDLGDFSLDNDSAHFLVDNSVPSRVHAQDASLYGFDPAIQEFVGNYFGWTTLASRPPVPIDQIVAFADEVRAEGLRAVVLIGQGGSTQASQTLTKLNSLVDDSIDFKTMDSVSPVYVSKILNECDPAHTVYIVSSKSGSTVEPTVLSRIAWDYVVEALGSEKAAGQRFVAITDPRSQLSDVARKNHWRAIFDGSPTVGGRFSAISVFGLLPAALDGIDIRSLMVESVRTEHLCSGNFVENPAVQLASFLYENYQAGRHIFSLVSPQPGRVFGLWIEQLIAESLGKEGKGILPNIEIDASMLAIPRDDRCAITYAIYPDESFKSDISRIDPSIPTLHCNIPDVVQIACHFILWEFATAFLAVLLKVNPFDQPNVQSTKSNVKKILTDTSHLGSTKGCTAIPLEDDGIILEAEMSPALSSGHGAGTLDEALEALFSSIGHGDYFATCAFLPFYTEQRRIPLEEIRHCVAAHLGATSCLEIGPRYLHSTGQLHKGGPNTGVFLILSSEEQDDLRIPTEDYTLGTLAHAQACGDMEALSSRDRRALRIHLADNDGETLARISARICAAACKVAANR